MEIVCGAGSYRLKGFVVGAWIEVGKCWECPMLGRESIATIYRNTLYLYYCNFHLNLPWGIHK